MDWGILLSSLCVGSPVVMGLFCSHWAKFHSCVVSRLLRRGQSPVSGAGCLTPRKERQEILSQSQPLRIPAGLPVVNLTNLSVLSCLAQTNKCKTDLLKAIEVVKWSGLKFWSIPGLTQLCQITFWKALQLLGHLFVNIKMALLKSCLAVSSAPS